MDTAELEHTVAALEPAEALRAVVALRRLADRMEDVTVERALGAGWSWLDIADELNVTRQAVHKKHFRRLEQAGVIKRQRRRRSV